MTYDLFAIRKEDFDNYGNNILQHVNFQDIWYQNNNFNYSHSIWKCWRQNYFVEPYVRENCIPNNLQYFYDKIFDKKSAYEFIDKVKNYRENYIDLKNFVFWLKFWADKDAHFYLSR